MPRRSGLNDNQVATLPRKLKRYNYADPEMRGHYLRVSPDRATPISYAAVARDSDGKQHWVTIGTVETLRIEQARELARQTIQQVKAGKSNSEPATVAAVAQEWLQRYVLKNGLRSSKSLKRVIDVCIVPRIGERTFTELKRSDIAKLLDVIQDNSGPQMADSVLAVLRGIGRWVQSRDDDYIAPFTARMARTPKAQRERARVLTDDEIRAVWKVDGTYGAAVKLLLLTAQRNDKVGSMRWDDIQGNVWTIRTDPREKGNAGKLKLPQAALAILHALPRFVSNPYVFPGRNGGDHFRGLTSGKSKADFDAKCGVTGWRIHDLRRTARSLMSRAGIPSEVAERVLGHVIPGVEGVYNRHEYFDEKADALARLAALVEEIVRRPSGRPQ
jgi:integrase